MFKAQQIQSLIVQIALVATAAYVTLPAIAADEVHPATPITKEEARDLKTESKAEYKARKKVTEAQKELEVADCKTSGLDSKEERDCKKEAKDAAKDAKKHAKEIYKDDKSTIKANTQ